MTGWNRVSIGGKAADVYQPTGADRPRFSVLFLHDTDLETLRGKTAFTRFFDDWRMTCVCPLAGVSWWVDRVCAAFDAQCSPERHLVASVLPFFQERWQLAPRAIGLLGIGMGGQGALRLAFKYPRLFPVVAALAPALDHHELYGQGTPLDELYDSNEQCRQDTALMHLPPYDAPPHIFFGIDPNDTQWYRGNDRLHEKMNALGVAHTADLDTEAGGHTWAYYEQMAERALRFLHTGLDHESRRLL